MANVKTQRGTEKELIDYARRQANQVELYATKHDLTIQEAAGRILADRPLMAELRYRALQGREGEWITTDNTLNVFQSLASTGRLPLYT